MDTGVVPAKEKAELLKIIFSKKMHSQNYWQLKSLNTQNTIYPSFSAGAEHN